MNYQTHEKDWFETLFGFRETDYDEAKTRLSVKHVTNPKTNLSEGMLRSSSKPGIQWNIGRFHYPTLGELRIRTRKVLEDASSGDNENDGEDSSSSANLTFRAVSVDVRKIHGRPSNRYATIQVASQFNCLEFVDPGVTPEDGVTGYSYDRTQGPACCSCTGPAVVYRNYMHRYEDEVVVVKTYVTDKNESSDGKTAKSKSANRKRERSLSDTRSQTGQTAHRQADMLSTFSRAIGNIPNNDKGGEGSPIFWDMKGGYMMSNSERLRMIPWNTICDGDDKGSTIGNNTYDELIQTIRIGLHEDIQVTHYGGFGSKVIRDTDMLVTHCLSSAVPVSYNTGHSRSSDWEPLARIILKASYECVFHAAILNMVRHNGEDGSRKIFLTSVGGGVFGNRSSWINDAILHCCKKFKSLNLEVVLVCYGKVNVESKRLEAKLNRIL